MKKRKLSELEMTSHGPIDDANGDLDTREAFENLLIECLEMKKIPQKSHKIKFLVSKIMYNSDHLYRINLERTKTFGHLCRLYKKYYKEDINIEEIQRQRAIRMQVETRRGQGRAAWGLYSNSVQMENVQKEHIEFEKSIEDLRESDKKKAREKFESKRGSVRMFIG